MVDQPKCKDLICGYLQESTHRRLQYVYMQMMPLIKVLHPNPPPPLPRQHHLEAGLVNTVNIENKRCFKWLLTGGKSKTTIEKSGW